MNKNKLKQFVNALDELSDDVKDWDVLMMSANKPSCDTCGCHAGLISIVAENLPELQEIYEPLYSLECESVGKKKNHYIFSVWSSALAIFLGFKYDNELEVWAGDNPRLWGNNHGYDMFCSRLAFTSDKNKWLTHRDLINHWKQVLVNIEA
ncbi:hypothetical protein [uncultured Gammaproteobacteria bacterium]|nr:hypothetical protein [uncultured Gammaproteobacteria bacterium]